ncbi:MAG: hypothetical protein DI536_05515 [Archangium gephyra]|uniref:Uncharacterized protein n=1 Tax=Archangium gephyra TaxID=48 RepID=A0A2W5V5J0_9BACT|nr:MAG: hypothetical protein DI536_05515 [Archangium gephyra]
MCVRVTCSKCGKPSWSGCGAHVEQVLAGVPMEARCACKRSSLLIPVLLVLAALFALNALRS